MCIIRYLFYKEQNREQIVRRRRDHRGLWCRCLLQVRVARCRVEEDIFYLSPKVLNCPHTEPLCYRRKPSKDFK